MPNSLWEVDGNVAKCMLDEYHSLLIERSDGRITMKVRDENGNILYTKYLTDKQLGLVG